jgi:hypothetical protein
MTILWALVALKMLGFITAAPPAGTYRHPDS